MENATIEDPAKTKIDKRTEKLVTVHGVQFKVFSRSVVAKALNRCLLTIQLWNKNGTIPEPIFDLKDGRRWYSAQEIRIFKALLEQEGLTRFGPDGKIKKSGKPIGRTNFKKRAALESRRLKKEVKDGKTEALASPI